MVVSKSVLFILHGSYEGVAFNLKRLIGCKYVAKAMVFTDNNYLIPPNNTHFKGKSSTNAVIHVTSMLEPHEEALKLQASMRNVFDCVVVAEFKTTKLQLLTDDDFMKNVDRAIALSDIKQPIEHRLKLLTTGR